MIFLAGLKRTLPAGVKLIELSKLSFKSLNLSLQGFDAIILSSSNALKPLCEVACLKDYEKSLFVLSKKTAKAAKAAGFKKVFYPKLAYASELLKEFDFKNKRVLYLRAKFISSGLDEGLLDQGALLTQVVAYENKPLLKEEILLNLKPLQSEIFTKSSLDSKLVLKKGSKVVFLAASAFCEFKKYFEINNDISLISIGKSCSKAMQGYSFTQAKEPSLASCLKAARLEDQVGV